MVRQVAKVTVGALALCIVAAVGYLLIAPPNLLKVGTNYSAKIVCSNVFIAGRNAEQVLSDDVQAPGHLLLRHVSIKVDPERKTVTARLFGILAPATSQYRAGLGCTNLHDTNLSDQTLNALPSNTAGLWPEGNDVNLSQDTALSDALTDPALLGPGYRAVVVVKNGRIVGESYAPGFDTETPLLGWSMTKTVTAALIGSLVQANKMSLDDTLTATYPNWAQDGREDITIEDMLAMSSGLDWNEDYGDVSDVTRMLYLKNNMAGFAADRPQSSETGSDFNYSSGTSTVLSRVWQDVVGDDSLTYPNDALFGPLAMTSTVLETDASDTFVGSSYMYATARDWARFGQLLLQDGVWDDQQVLPQGFTEWMFEPVETSNGQYAKGHLWLQAPGSPSPFEDAVWLQGHDGQSIGIFPSRDMVVVRLGLTPSRLGYSPLPLVEAIIDALGN
ncbi:MAG: serine hydrolase domain-containing protein [Ruegeria sp.]